MPLNTFAPRLMASTSSSMRSAIPPRSLSLKTACGDVCKATYALRLNGDKIPEASLGGFTATLRDSIGVTLGGELGDEPWEQATCAEGEGGLGMRTPEEVSLPAFVASRATARPAACALFARLEAAGLAGRGALRSAYDARGAAAFARLLDRAGDDQPLRDQLRAMCEASARAAQDSWDAAAAGREEPPRPRGFRRLGDLDDDDSPVGLPRAPSLQANLSRALDARKGGEVRSAMRTSGAWQTCATLTRITLACGRSTLSLARSWQRVTGTALLHLAAVGCARRLSGRFLLELKEVRYSR